jgi:hypothetical protein
LQIARLGPDTDIRDSKSSTEQPAAAYLAFEIVEHRRQLLA